MRANLIFLIGVFVSAFVTEALADPKSAYIDFAAFGLGDNEEATVEVNLRGPLLKLIAMASEEDDDPAVRRLIEGLESITVRTYALDDHSSAAVEKKIADVSKKLEADGWETIVRVRERDERAHIAVKMDGERIIGLTVVALDDEEELALINIVGDIDLNSISKLGRHLDVDALDSLDSDDLKRPDKKK